LQLLLVFTNTFLASNSTMWKTVNRLPLQQLIVPDIGLVLSLSTLPILRFDRNILIIC